MAAISNAAAELIAGVEPAQVIQTMRQHYTTDASMASNMSLVRTAVRERGHRPPDDFRLPRTSTNALKRKRDDAVIKKNETLIVVEDFGALLRTATAALQSATTDCSFASLILPLLLVSGRRLTEICSPRSTFKPTQHVHYTIFEGALKKRGHARPMVIPLLVPFSVFSVGLLALRQKQGASLANLSNTQIKNRYQGSVQRDLTQRDALPGAPSGIHTHDLRSVYLAATFAMFNSPYTLARTGMLVLGHETLREHLSYNNVRLRGVGALEGSLGPLHVFANAEVDD